MQPSINSLIIGFVLAMTGVTYGLPVFAEKFDHTLSKSNVRTIYRNAANIGGPSHEVGQELLITELKSSNPKIKVKEEWVFNQFDFVDGAGKHWGTYVDFHEDGSQTYGSYEGSQKTVAGKDGAWTVTWEGIYRYTGGSGTYKNVKGGGTYKGRASSAGEYVEEEKESIEY